MLSVPLVRSRIAYHPIAVLRLPSVVNLPASCHINVLKIHAVISLPAQTQKVVLCVPPLSSIPAVIRGQSNPVAYSIRYLLPVSIVLRAVLAPEI